MLFNTVGCCWWRWIYCIFLLHKRIQIIPKITLARHTFAIFNFSHPQHSKAHWKMKCFSILFLFCVICTHSRCWCHLCIAKIKVRIGSTEWNENYEKLLHVPGWKKAFTMSVLHQSFVHVFHSFTHSLIYLCWHFESFCCKLKVKLGCRLRVGHSRKYFCK